MPKTRDEPNTVTYVWYNDVDVVKRRIPPEFKTRLRDVFLHYKSRGVRELGYVMRRGKRDIVICALLPPRVSLRRFVPRGRTAEEFGAPARGQWPPWSVRRFLLYDVFLHELGHLQLVNPKAKGWKRKYAGETKAQDFANRMRAELWSKPFEHPDPVHSPPTKKELETIELWKTLNKKQRFKLVKLVLGAPHDGDLDLGCFGNPTKNQRDFLERALRFECNLE